MAKPWAIIKEKALPTYICSTHTRVQPFSKVDNLEGSSVHTRVLLCDLLSQEGLRVALGTC